MTKIHNKVEAWFSNFTALVIRHRYISFVGMLLMTMMLASQMSKLTIDTRDESLFHEDDPALVAYNDFRDTFGQDDIFIVALKPEKAMDHHFFSILYRLHRDLENAVPYLDEITSLANARHMRADGDTLYVEDLMETPPTRPEDARRIHQLIDRYPMYENLLISKDRTVACILVRARAVIGESADDVLDGFGDAESASPAASETHRYLSNEQNVQINKVIREVTSAYEGKGIEFHFTGTPAFVAEIQQGIEKDLSTMIPLSFAVIIVFLLFLFRRISGVMYPLITVAFSLMSCLGIMGATGIPITNAIQILPVFLLVVGIGDSVHILAVFYRVYRKTADKRQAIIQTMGIAGLPVLMTSVTTASGLLSFAFADVAIIAQLGWVAPIGVMLAFLYTVVMLPAMIVIFPLKKAKPVSDGARPFAERIFATITQTTTRRPIPVSIIFGIVLSVAVFGASFLRFSHNALTWFPEKNPIRASTEFIDKLNGGSVVMEVTVNTKKENGLHDPELLHRLDRAALRLPQIEVRGLRAGKVWSIADVLKEINRALNEDRDDAYEAPDTREMAAQELILFESSGSDDLEDVADSIYQTGRLSVLAPFADASQYKEYLDVVMPYLEDQFREEDVAVTGHMLLFARMIERFITSMVKSYAAALFVITLLMILIIGRIRIGLMSMVANIVPIVCVFGLMGALDIPVDMSTILIGSLVLGLVVDDTIHFLHHFRREYEKTPNVETAVLETFNATGRALAVTSLVLCGGFFIYMTSYLANNVRFGLLSGCGVLFALVADFFLVPALLSLMYRSKDTSTAKHEEDAEPIPVHISPR